MQEKENRLFFSFFFIFCKKMDIFTAYGANHDI